MVGRKVHSGEKLTISATTWNTFIDAARDYQQRRQNTLGQAQAQPADRGIVLVRNDSGGDRERFDVLGISGPIFAPADAPDTFKQAVMLAGVTPTADHFGSFVVLLAPLAAGAIGPAMAAGVTVCKLNVIAEAHQFADAANGVATSLKTQAYGTARILWKESGTGAKWGVVSIGRLLGMLSPTPAQYSMGTFEDETAQNDTWSRSSQVAGYEGLRVRVVCREAYNHAGDKKLYAFYRDLTFDSAGCLTAMTAETRVEVDAVEPCS